jgi:peroxiredoxin
MLPLGTLAPDFSLPDYEGDTYSLSDFSENPAFLVMFICNHCPFVQHVRTELVRLVKEYQEKGAAAVAIYSNDISVYPEDGPEQTAEVAATQGFTFPVLFDESQQVAKAYHAACTPDFYVFDSSRKLVYRGQMDDSRPGNGKPVTGHDLRAALDAVLEGRHMPALQLPSIGCNIKWKPANEPEYAKGTV